MSLEGGHPDDLIISQTHKEAQPFFSDCFLEIKPLDKAGLESAYLVGTEGRHFAVIINPNSDGARKKAHTALTDRNMFRPLHANHPASFSGMRGLTFGSHLAFVLKDQASRPS
jgi:hypothetical protein